MIPKPLDQIGPEDLQRLVDNRAKEGTTLEFKTELGPGGLDGYVQHVCSFANTEGGDLIYGIQEDDHVAVAVCGLPSEGLEVLLQKMEHAARDGLDQRLSMSALRIRPVDISNDRVVIVVRIARSLRGPHKVDRGKENRFFGRSTVGKVPMSASQIISHVEESASWRDGTDAWRRHRVGKLEGGLAEVKLPSLPEGHHAHVYVHVVPVGGVRAVDVADSAVEAQLVEIGTPRATRAATAAPALLGLYVCEGPSDLVRSYAYWLEDGRVELGAVVRVRDPNLPHSASIDGENLECGLYRSVGAAFQGLNALDIPPPYLVYVTLAGGAGLNISYSGVSVPGDEAVRKLNGDIFLPGHLIDSTEDVDLWELLRPMLNRLARSSGYRQSRFFNSNNGPRIRHRIECH